VIEGVFLVDSSARTALPSRGCYAWFINSSSDLPEKEEVGQEEEE